MAKTYEQYKLEKVFKSGLFWAITVGILITMAVLITLPIVSINAIDDQWSSLEAEINSDLSKTQLLPTTEDGATASEGLTTNEFLDTLSIEANGGDILASSQAKEDNFKLDPLVNTNYFRLITEIANIFLESLATDGTFVGGFMTGLMNWAANTPDLHVGISITGGTSLLNGGEAALSGLSYLNDNGNEKYVNVNSLPNNESIISLADVDPMITDGSTEDVPLFGYEQILKGEDSPILTFIISIIEANAPIGITATLYSQTTLDGLDSNGNIWWEDADQDGIVNFAGTDEEYTYINTSDDGTIPNQSTIINLGVKKLGVPLADVYLQIPMSYSTINQVFWWKTFAYSNNIENILLGNDTEEHDPSFSNVHYVLKTFMNQVNEQYNDGSVQEVTTNLQALYYYVYVETNWQEPWSILISDYDLVGVSGLTIEELQEPSFDTFYFVTREYHLLLDSLFEGVRQELIDAAIHSVNIKDIPYSNFDNVN